MALLSCKALGRAVSDVKEDGHGGTEGRRDVDGRWFMRQDSWLDNAKGIDLLFFFAAIVWVIRSKDSQ